jgi:hypothetical protein
MFEVLWLSPEQLAEIPAALDGKSLATLSKEFC